MTLDEAESAVGADFDLEVAGTENSEQPEGAILSQTPSPNQTAGQGSTISVVTSSGYESVEVPDVSGMYFDNANQVLLNEGLTLDPNPQLVRSSEPSLTVLRTEPAAGSEVRPGTPVQVFTSDGLNFAE